MKVLIVDDEHDHVELLSFALRRAGLTPLGAHDVASARKLLAQEQPDLVVLDINLGATSGLDLLVELRRYSRLPVILLTGRGSEDDKVRGLELGADDYLTKPFSHRELVARIRARLRWQHEPATVERAAEPEVLEAGPLRLSVPEHQVTRDGEPVSLTLTEFRLLRELMQNAGSVVPAEALLNRVWGYADPGGTDVLRVTVHRLRRKLGDDSGQPRLLHTIPGVGIQLRLDAAGE